MMAKALAMSSSRATPRIVTSSTNNRCVFCFRRSKIELKIPFSDTHRDMVYDTCLMAFLLFAFAWAAKSLANLAIYEFKIPLDFMGDSGDFASSSCH